MTGSKTSSENGVWDRMRPLLNHFGHFCRVETGATNIGFPDVSYCLKGAEGHIELKYVKKAKDKFTLRPAQYQWLSQRIRNEGKRLWIMAHIAETHQWILIRCDSVDKLKSLISDGSTKNWLSKAFFVYKGMNRLSVLTLVVHLTMDGEEDGSIE